MSIRKKVIMKKIFIIALASLLLFGCSSEPAQTSSKPTEKIDVSTLNILDLGAETADMSGYTLLTDTKHVFKKITMEESIRLFEEKGSGLIYYGHDQCAFCQQAVPVLNNAARQMGVDIYYVDVYSKDGYSEEIYAKLVDIIKDHLKVVDGVPTFYVPQVFVIKDGEIVGEHLSLVDSYNINEDGDMNEKQRNELKKIYIEIIEKLR